MWVCMCTALSSLFRFELNTCIEPPHNEKVTSLLFQPPRVTKQTKTIRKTDRLLSEPSPATLLSVSTSEDGKFKSWILVDTELKGEEKKREMSWACRSVGYYHSLPCRGACFSEDGSLLAVNFKKVSLCNAFSIAYASEHAQFYPPVCYTLESIYM